MLESTNIIVESADIDNTPASVDVGLVSIVGRFVLLIIAVYVHHHPDVLEGRIKIHPLLKAAITMLVSFVWFCVTMVIASIVITICLTIFMIVLTIAVS